MSSYNGMTAMQCAPNGHFSQPGMATSGSWLHNLLNLNFETMDEVEVDCTFIVKVILINDQ